MSKQIGISIQVIHFICQTYNNKNKFDRIKNHEESKQLIGSV